MKLLQKKQSGEKEIIAPAVNIHETDEEIVLSAEMPGINKEDIKVEIKGDELIIEGKKQEEVVEKGYQVVYQERFNFDYRRSFLLGKDVDRNNIKATYRNGILTIRIPKTDQAKPQTIEIKEE